MACSERAPASNVDDPSSNSNQRAVESEGIARVVLSEPERKKICEEIDRIRTQAYLEANTKYPMVVLGERSAPARMIEQARKRARLIGDLMEKHMTRLANQHHLSKTQLMEIEEEGIDKDWIRIATRPQVYK
jgi:hypothetical protein